MTTFQRSISFLGDTDDLPSVWVTVEIPRLSFAASEDDVAVAYVTPGGSATFAHPTPESTYRVTVSGDLLVDDAAETRALAARYYTTALAAGDLDAFALPVAVSYRSPDGQLLGSSELSVLAIPRFAAEAPTRLSNLSAARAPRFDAPLVLNHAQLLSLRSMVEGLDDDRLLLLAVLGCTLVIDDTPTFSDTGFKRMGEYLETQGMPSARSAALLDVIRKLYEKLVDVELKIPAPQRLQIAGTLKISAPDDVTVTAADFTAFEIIAEWADAGTGRPEDRSFSFTGQTTVTENSAAFGLTESDALYRNAVAGDVGVRVSGMGVPLWSRTFRADDPELAALSITVARQVAGTRTSLDVPPTDPNLRLRGRVIVLHPNCAVKDVFVFVQAKASEDAEWHVVGAAAADPAGNFSVPYPYGTHVAARAVCSVAPRSPATIPIVAATGARTISEDFIYIVVENTLVPDEPCGSAECGCDDPKAPGRLPDFEDLIGSDVYSQDLGTGCINLSTPNRTINEYAFQAIVRTSDPHVATYQLSRHELGLGEIDIAQVAALVAGAGMLIGRATAASGMSVTQDATAESQLLLNAVTTVHPRALAVATALPSSGWVLQRLDPAAVTTAQADLAAIIATLEAARSQLGQAGAFLSPAADDTLTSARKLEQLLDRGPYLFELDYVQQVANLATVLAANATAALDSSRVNAQAPRRTSEALVTAIASIGPHVQAVGAALNPGGPPITLSALAKVYTHLDAVTSILPVALGELARQGVGTPPTLQAVLDAAQTLKPLVDNAIDTAGTSVRYELTDATGTRTRQLVGLTNPIEWERAPEPASAGTGPLLKQGFKAFKGQRLPADPAGAKAEFAQAVSVATGHIIHYKVVFKADGYSLGDVVYSLPLAPGQKKEIVVFDSSQTLLGTEAQQLTQNERLAMGLVDERDITSQLAGNLSESLRGSSSANTSGISAGFGTGGQGSGGTGAYGGSGSAVLGVAGGVAQASSSAQENASRDLSQFFGEKLRQTIMQNAEGYRALNASVVTAVQQGQRYGVTSEVVANHNHCHSLTMMYFEVLRHYAIFQTLASVEECVFVPLLLARFSVDNIVAWRDVLAPALLPMPSETYMQPFVTMAGSVREHPLIKGFDAVQRLRTSYANVDMPAGSFDEEPIRFVKGSMQLRVNLPRPKTRYDRIKSLPVVNRVQTPNPASVVKGSTTDAILAGLTGGLSMIFTGPPGHEVLDETKIVQGKQAIFDAFMSMDANYENVPPAQCIRVNNFRPVTLTFNGVTVQQQALDLFEDGKRDKEQWEQYSRLLGYTDVVDMLEYYFRGRLISEWDDIFYGDIVPLVFDELVNNLRLSQFAIDVTALRRYTGGEQRIAVNISGTTNKTRAQLPDQLQLSAAGASAQALRKHVTLDVEELTLNYSTAHYNGVLYSGSLGDDLLDGVPLDIPERPDEKRNPHREDRYLAAALIEHLNSNLEHYNRVLWTRLDPDRRYMLLDGFAIQVYDADGVAVPASDGGMRSLASVVKNEVLTVAGNSLVLPVAPGYRVSGALIEAKGPGGKAKKVSLFDHYKPLTPVSPYRVSVPTRGVFAEAIQGQCNACEKLETDRLQDWSRFPGDEPTPIAPIALPTPSPQDWQAAWREFAQPMVNIQNAPGMPAPGAGLAGLADALTTSGVFKDITGLDANQQNALKTYLSNQENAKAFAEMAKEMAMQSHNTSNSGRIMDTIAAARTSGAITPAEASQLVKDHLQQQVDGGAAKKAQDETNAKAAATPLSQIAVTGASQGKDVTASRLDGAGNSESVSISGPQTSRVLAEVPGTVPRLHQDKKNDCWAVAAAMMIGWRSRQETTAAAAAAAAGRAYLEMYNAETGLFAADQDDFILHSEMVSEPPASYPLSKYVEWMGAYGPLWVTIDAGPGTMFSPHAWVLTRIAGTGEPDGTGTYVTHINPTNGAEITQTFADFMRAYEQMAIEDGAPDLRAQVIHFAATVTAPTGYQIEGSFDIHEPVHEDITLAALRVSTVPVPPGTTVGSNLAVNEFLRGVIFNDDPALLLFHELTKDNWKFTNGLNWKKQFDTAKGATTNDLQNLTGRSHFFDLQFLHAMANVKDEQPADTLARILLWAEVMYRLSIGEGIAGTDLLSSVPIASAVTAANGTQYSYKLSQFFDAKTRPRGTDTLDALLTRRTLLAGARLDRRAIGSLLHIVQDSYARGHVRRTLLNPGDLQQDSTDQFKPGTWGHYGEIENFHCYRGQDAAQHDKHDVSTETDATKLDSFNSLLGARDAIEASRRLLDMWQAKTAWAAAGGPKEYLVGTVFKLAATASPADTSV